MNLLTSLFAVKTVDMNAEYVASVVITGLTVVFVGLLLLVIFVSLFGTFFNKSNNGKKKVEPTTKAEKTPTQTKSVPTPVIEDGISDEVVAVITAAISAMSSASGGKVLAVRSIRQQKTLRPAWANAGILENTRPF